MYGDFHGENLMVRENGDLVLTDFGWAAWMIEENDGNMTINGTARNFAQEFINIWCKHFFFIDISKEKCRLLAPYN